LIFIAKPNWRKNAAGADIEGYSKEFKKLTDLTPRSYGLTMKNFP